jgi:hypothetical protein
VTQAGTWYFVLFQIEKIDEIDLGNNSGEIPSFYPRPHRKPKVSQPYPRDAPAQHLTPAK